MADHADKVQSGHCVGAEFPLTFIAPHWRRLAKLVDELNVSLYGMEVARGEVAELAFGLAGGDFIVHGAVV